jgi:hypothetical protein
MAATALSPAPGSQKLEESNAKKPCRPPGVLKTMSAAAAVGAIAAQPHPAAAQQVKWSARTEAPKMRAPADAADCHNHIYDAKYPGRPALDIAAQRRLGRGLPGIAAPHRHEP